MARDNIFTSIKLDTKPVDFSSTAKMSKEVFTNLSDFIGSKHKKEQENLLANVAADLEQQKFTGTLTPESMQNLFKSAELIEDPTKRTQFIKDVGLAEQEQAIGKFNAALYRGNQTGDFSDANSIRFTNPVKQQEALEKVTNARNLFDQSKLTLEASTGDVANALAMKKSVVDSNKTPTEKAALLAIIDKQLASIAPKEVFKTGLSAIQQLDTTLRNQRGLDKSVLEDIGQVTPELMPAISRHFEEVEGRVVPIDPSLLVQRQKQEALDYAGNDNAKYEEKLEEIIKRDDLEKGKIISALDEFKRYKPTDLGSEQDDILKNAAASYAAMGVDAQQTDAGLANLRSLAARQFELGDKKATALQGRIANIDTKVNDQIAQQKDLSDLTRKMSDMEIAAVAKAAGGEYKNVGAAVNEIPASAWGKWGGKQEEVAKEVITVLGNGITLKDENGNDITVVPNPNQIEIALDLATESGWLRNGKFVNADKFKSNLENIVKKQVADSAPIREQYKKDEIERIKKFYQFQRDAKARAGAEKLTITQRAYADAELPYEQRNLGNSALDIFGKALSTALGIGNAGAAQLAGVPGGTPSNSVGNAANTTPVTVEKARELLIPTPKNQKELRQQLGASPESKVTGASFMQAPAAAFDVIAAPVNTTINALFGTNLTPTPATDSFVRGPLAEAGNTTQSTNPNININTRFDTVKGKLVPRNNGYDIPKDLATIGIDINVNAKQNPIATSALQFAIDKVKSNTPTHQKSYKFLYDLAKSRGEKGKEVDTLEQLANGTIPANLATFDKAVSRASLEPITDDVTNSPAVERITAGVYGQESSSGTNPNANKENYAGALGPMQIIEPTWNAFQKIGVIPASYKRENTEQNKEAGQRIIGYLFKKYNGDVDKVLAAYYAGEGAINKDGSINLTWRDKKNDKAPTVGEYIEQTKAKMPK